LEAFLVSTGIVALAEMGDKTQLLSLLLAARFRRPWPIVLGILIATAVNHALAGALGAWITTLVGPDTLRWALGVSFLAMAAWMLVPDKAGDGYAGAEKYGVLATTIVAFFLAEMGDKTQVATVALAAKYSALWSVVAGTTLGMMIANVPVVLLGDRLAERIPLRLTRMVAAAIFAILGALVLLDGYAKVNAITEKSSSNCVSSTLARERSRSAWGSGGGSTAAVVSSDTKSSSVPMPSGVAISKAPSLKT
jgi:putative Ca2+/H+ antiporter (TMEM165/GDT1 family)